MKEGKIIFKKFDGKEAFRNGTRLKVMLEGYPGLLGWSAGNKYSKEFEANEEGNTLVTIDNEDKINEGRINWW